MITLLINRLSEHLSLYEPFQILNKRVQSNTFPVHIEGPQKGFYPFLLEQIHSNLSGTSLVVVPTEQEAEELIQDLGLFPDYESMHFPAWGTLPYSDGYPLPTVFGERVRVLIHLLERGKSMVVMPLKAFLCPVPDPVYLSSQKKRISVGDTLDPGFFSILLQSFGYLRVPRVSLKGEYSLRGEVIDVFPFGEEEAVRIVLDFDKVAEIKLFNPLTQISTHHKERLTIPPVREIIPTECDSEDVKHILERFETYSEKPGIEYYFPLCFKRKFSVLDYVGEDSTLFLIDSERLESSAKALRREYLALYKKSPEKDLMPEKILLDFRYLKSSFQRQVHFHSLKAPAGGKDRIKIESETPRSFFGNITYFREELENLLQLGYNVFIFAVYQYQAERIRHLVKDLDVHVFPAGISCGFALPQFKIIIIQENEIFGRKKRIPRSIVQSESQVIESFVDLSPGDFVVHINYGIGLFNGIERIKAAGWERDYIHLEFAEGERVYLPIEQVNLIQRYIGQKQPRLDRIGGKGWEAKKNRVKKSIEDLARMLVTLYSRRNEIKGFVFPHDSEWQGEFEAGFAFQETADQLRCIEVVKEDMESSRPMDRLICGDVGYGKTEIALRAAFKAVMGGKQVALLAPTTILVEQHFETFCERFERYPVNIEMLSRFRNRSEQKHVVRQVKEGQTDIVIGTHRLLQRDVQFKDLGLLVVDEEQRFGVKHKENLKELKASVDCLTLTATPIPRTLHMSLMKIRDMSLINTPPQNRLPIETFIQEFNEEVVAQAVQKEVTRGGQVYYLHNRIQTMPNIHVFLKKLLPHVGVEIAHGQMESDELEDIMHRFIRKDFDVLLSTSIIENGLDIPNVNTIIIDRADMFGISQLYQFRGRVGRSDRPAYAYMLYPKGKAISEIAMKRLKIISDFTELGSGFKIALKDLEIRGAGNLLGREQHGDILAVGLDMYLRLLDEAVRELGEEKTDEPLEVLLELEYSGYIPDSYMREPMAKMEVYKKIASIIADPDLDAVLRELTDRFGPIPDEVMSLFSIAEIRILCKKLFVSSLKEKEGIVRVEFTKLARIDVDRVLTLVKESGGTVRLDSKQPNCILINTQKIDLKDKSEYISERLTRLL